MRTTAALLSLALLSCAAPGAGGPAAYAPLHATLDLDLDESAVAELPGGLRVPVRLVSLHEERDEICDAVRRAEVALEVDGRRLAVVAGTYHLPVPAGRVRVDCAVTKGYVSNARENVWGLLKAARIRIWPADSPLLPPGSFGYPARQRWFATHTQMGNEPVFVDGGDLPGPRKIYYHYGCDIGGSEGDVDVVAATDGLVVSAGKEILPEHAKDTPAKPRYDVVYLLDPRGWYYRYSHLKTIDVGLGQRVQLGQKLGLLGKEGGSGGWSHLHFDITRRQPSGLWGIEEGYPFLFEAYHREHPSPVVAVARPHHLVWAGKSARLDGTRSQGRGLRAEWTFTDGTRAAGATVERRYETPGHYSEILTVTDAEGRTDVDFQVVQVLDPKDPKTLPPSIQAVYTPTFGIRAGDPVRFKVRSFRTPKGGERWDFGDGTPPVEVKSDGNAVMLAPDGFAETTHRFAKPGRYVVRVDHAGAKGYPATAHLHVAVGP